jgi:hypothetical protein
MYVFSGPMGLATTRVIEKRRRVIVDCLVSKLDDHRPWDKETLLLDRGKNEKQHKSLSLL